MANVLPLQDRGDALVLYAPPAPAHRTNHLQIVPYESQLWFERLAFCDTLRTDAQLKVEARVL